MASKSLFWGFLAFSIFIVFPKHAFDAEDVCTKINPLRPRMTDSGSKDSRQPLCYREHPEQDESWESPFITASQFTCVKTDGVNPPDRLTSFMTSLLHERDVTHHLTWTGSFWSLGSGAYADVHLGRLCPTGECVVVKQFLDSPLSTIEREIHIHRYIEQVLPSTPRLLGLLPSGPELHNASLVYQLVPDSYTLHDWLKLTSSLSTVQWLSVALQLAEAMETLHRKCVLHNDLHSSNILVHLQHHNRHDDPDCGISRLMESQEDTYLMTMLLRSVAKFKDTTLPKVTVIDFGHATFRKGKVYKGSEESLASCHHLAPEVIQHNVTSPASDVYSLGHELLHIAEVVNSSSLENVALWCVDSAPEARPPVAEVVHRLRGLFVNECRRHSFLQGAPSGNRNHLLSMGLSLVKENSCHSSVHNPIVIRSFLQSGHYWQPFYLQRSSVHLPHHNPKSLRQKHVTESCLPQLVERAMSKISVPYITFTGDLTFKTVGGKKVKLFDSKHTAIFIGQFGSTGEGVVIKTLKTNDDYFTIRYEAMASAYLNETGWVPKFYGVVPLNKYDFHQLGVVQEKFAEGVTLEEVLESGRPFGVTARIELAHQLTSLLHDIHLRHVLINNFKLDNILCACVSDRNCSHIRLIDLGEMSGCEGKRFNAEENYLRHFPYLAPEVRQNQLTSFPSDVFSLCVVLDAVLEKDVLGNRDNSTDNNIDKQRDSGRDVGAVVQFLRSWGSLCRLCFSGDRYLRPSTFQLKHFFSAFLKTS